MSMCLWFALFRLSLPLPVSLNLFAAPLLVFCFGILFSYSYYGDVATFSVTVIFVLFSKAVKIITFVIYTKKITSIIPHMNSILIEILGRYNLENLIISQNLIKFKYNGKNVNFIFSKQVRKKIRGKKIP